MNRISLRGRVGSEPEVKTTNAGAKVASFRLATEESWKVGDDWKKRTTWHTVQTFRPADVRIIETLIEKGDLVRVDGTLRIEEYTDKENVKRIAPKIVTTEWEHGVYLDERGAAKDEAQTDGDGHTQKSADTCEELPF